MNVKFTFNRNNISQSVQPGLKAHVQYVSKVVDSPAPAGTGAKSITANGTYYAISEGLEGYNVVDVNVSGGGGSATLIEKSITANGTYNASSDSADGYSKVVVSVPASAVDTGTKSITANGNNQDVVGYAAVDVNVPNTYAAGDEGKVVSNGALVAQTSDTVTTNDTYDTTLINSLTVNVSGGGGGLEYEEGTYTAASDSNPTITFSNSHNTAPIFVIFVDSTGNAQTTSNRGTVCVLGNVGAVVSGGVPYGGGTADGIYSALYRGSSSDTGAGGNRSPISTNLTSSNFTPFFGTSARTCQSGRTYKWIAVWR